MGVEKEKEEEVETPKTSTTPPTKSRPSLRRRDSSLFCKESAAGATRVSLSLSHGTGAVSAGEAALVPWLKARKERIEK